jgi:hypothetical protein
MRKQEMVRSTPAEKPQKPRRWASAPSAYFRFPKRLCQRIKGIPPRITTLSLGKSEPSPWVIAPCSKLEESPPALRCTTGSLIAMRRCEIHSGFLHTAGRELRHPCFGEPPRPSKSDRSPRFHRTREHTSRKRSITGKATAFRCVREKSEKFRPSKVPKVFKACRRSIVWTDGTVRDVQHNAT